MLKNNKTGYNWMFQIIIRHYNHTVDCNQHCTVDGVIL